MSRGGMEHTFNLSGNKGLAGVAIAVVALLLVGVRATTLGESDDERLRTVVKAELVTKMSGEASRALEALDATDPDALEAFLKTVDADAIQVHSTRVSKPLLSMSSDEEVIVLVDYTLPGASRTSEYWRMRYSTISGWRHRGHATAIGYYLNFL